MYVCMYVCINCKCMYVCECMYLCMYDHEYVCICVCMYVLIVNMCRADEKDPGLSKKSAESVKKLGHKSFLILDIIYIRMVTKIVTREYHV